MRLRMSLACVSFAEASIAPSSLPLDHTFEPQCGCGGVRDRTELANIQMQEIESAIVFVRIHDQFVIHRDHLGRPPDSLA